jgi:MFS family permease
MSRTFASLAERNYRLYAAGSWVSNVGTWMMHTALTWLVLELTGEGAAVGLAVALQLVPTLLLSPLGGLLADRHAKHAVLRVMQVAMALPAAILGVLAVAGVVQPWQVYVLAFVFGIGRALEAPARQAFVTELVADELVGNAVALNSASFHTGRLVGPAVAGVLIAALGSGTAGPGWVMLLNAASYGAAFAALQLLERDRLRQASTLTVKRRAIRDSLRYVLARPDLKLVFLCVFFIGGFGMSFQITSALMAQVEFDRGARGFGLLGSLLAAGSVAGSLLVARRREAGPEVIVLAGLSLSALQVLSGVMPTFATYAAVLPFVGASFLIAGTVSTASIQLGTDPALRGRVTSLYVMVFVGSVPLVAPAIGWCGDAWGPRAAVILSGAVSGIGVAGSCAWYLVRRSRAGQAPRRASVSSGLS